MIVLQMITVMLILIMMIVIMKITFIIIEDNMQIFHAFLLNINS